jgi:hypothetical protein
LRSDEISLCFEWGVFLIFGHDKKVEPLNISDELEWNGFGDYFRIQRKTARKRE